jgi:hypothetical protein
MSATPKNGTTTMSHARFCKITSSLAFTVAAILLLICSSFVGQAQSGRRQKPKATTVPIEETPATTTTSETRKPDFNLAVSIERSSFDQVPNWYFGTVLASCADRLKSTPAVSVSAGDTDTTRADAINAAKNSKDTHIVWLQLRNDSLSADRSWSNVNDITVEYFVYAPITAKVVTSGRAYNHGYRKGPVVVGPGSSGTTTNAIGAEALLRQMGRDVADSILSGLHIGGNIPPTH